MGFLGDISFGLLGDTSAEEAAQQASAAIGKVKPTDIQTSLGGLTFGDNVFTTALDPRLQQIQGGLLGQIEGLESGSTLGMLRQQAAPFEEQQRLALENRLFSQGLLGASGVDQPGGARRSLFEAQAQADLARQLQAQQLMMQQRGSLFGGLGAISGIERGLFGTSMGMFGQQLGQTQAAQAPLMQAGQSTTSAMQGLVASALGGYMGSGGTFGMGGGGVQSTLNPVGMTNVGGGLQVPGLF